MIIIHIKLLSSDRIHLKSVVERFAFPPSPGCHARSMPEPRSDPWEEALEKFKDYFTDLTSKSDAMLKDIKSHEITRELE